MKGKPLQNVGKLNHPILQQTHSEEQSEKEKVRRITQVTPDISRSKVTGKPTWTSGINISHSNLSEFKFSMLQPFFVKTHKETNAKCFISFKEECTLSRDYYETLCLSRTTDPVRKGPLAGSMCPPSPEDCLVTLPSGSITFTLLP